MADLHLVADLLDAAARLGASLSPLAVKHGLTLDEAYAIQNELVARRLTRGDGLTGLKMGFTSEAMRRQMNVKAPNIGWLTSGMALSDHEFPVDAFIHPRLEPEVAILLGRDIDGPAEMESLRGCVKAYAPAIELVDSRFHDYKFAWLDNVADNSSSAGYVLGPWVGAECDVGALRATLSLDGAIVDEGESSAVMGHPLLSLAEGARIAHSLGKSLRAGMVVLTGGITRAHPILAGQTATADFGDFGQVTLTAR
jgi:2-keto-4-pentenoate hydratase